ncbi:helix-turn-helix domain-containing protein [uncultured Bacteroides sp.]|uniref:helix-turn-helix domain-containing protein n=1 Tax=uncultured Bacteroides sp. TaxID=162156 RepID=UPI002AABEFFF|nr:helix-turn-helix domain-containing protein [uncultured Bacteroides sp.]
MQSIFKQLVAQLGLLKERESFQTESDIIEAINPSMIDLDQEVHIYKEVLYNLDSKQIYLDSSLSLIKLSSVVGTNTTYLSNSINKYFGCNFKTLINRYRIEYCKKLLGTNPMSVPIKEIAKKCGFSSVSAFYSSFKKITGISPVQYRILVIYRNETNKEFEKEL